jgi:hypothetical protein
MSEKMTEKFKRLILENAWLGVIGIGIFLFLLAWILYESCGALVIEAMYEGKTPGFLSDLIQYSHKHSLEHYLRVGDILFYRFLYLYLLGFCCGVGIITIISRLIFSKKAVRIEWCILVGVLIVLWMYLSNPKVRIYANHSFYRAAIVYQILNGFVPPLDPLFAGEAYHSSWGFPWLAAKITHFLNISPFQSFALINIVSIGLSIYLIYRISGLVLKDEKANIFSAVIAIFGVTILDGRGILFLSTLFNLPNVEYRALPVFNKFLNANGVPIGLVFFLFFVYSVIKLYECESLKKYSVLLLLSILGCGFLYVPFLPCVMATVGILFLLHVLLFKREIFIKSYLPDIILISGLILSCLVLYPYILSAKSGVGTKCQFFNVKYILGKSAIYFMFSTPLLAIVYYNRKYLFEKMHKRNTIILLSVLIQAAGCYFFVHIPIWIEYKFLIITSVMLGIVGGLAFRRICQIWHKPFVLLLLCLFLWPSYYIYLGKVTKYENRPIFSILSSKGYIEKGKWLVSPDEEKNELYQWIRENTPADSCFLDTEWDIPIYAQRRLFIGLDRPGKPPANGYGRRMENLLLFLNYDFEEFERRKKVIKSIYGIESSLSKKEAFADLAAVNCYIVVREKKLGSELLSEGLEEVFSTSKSNLSVFKTRTFN